MNWFRGIAVATMMLAPWSVSAQDDPIKIGTLYITSGPFSTYGEFARRGVQMAVDEINDSGGILDRPLEAVYADSGAKANVAINSIRQLVTQDGVHALMGLDSSGTARAVTPLMRQFKRPLMITHAATPDVTGRLCNEWVFRNSVNLAQNNRAGAEIAKDLDATTWTTIGGNEAFGRQSWEFFQKYLKEQKESVEFLEPNLTKFGGDDFKPVIENVIAQSPDAVHISLWGSVLADFIEQATASGFFDQDFEVLMTLGGAAEVLSAVGDTMPQDVWVGTRYWFEGPTHDRNTEFVAAFQSEYGVPPSYNAQNSYMAVYAYKAAIEKAGATDPQAIAKALEGLTLTAPMGEVRFRPEDHQAVVDTFWGKTADMGSHGLRSLDPIRIGAGADMIQPIAVTGCQL